MSEPTRAGRAGESQPLPISVNASKGVMNPLQADVARHAECQSIPEAVWLGIFNDLYSRTTLGIELYGHPLETWNGRNATVDAYEESLDLLQYLKQRCMENPTNGHYRIAYWNAMAMAFSLKEDLLG